MSRSRKKSPIELRRHHHELTLKNFSGELGIDMDLDVPEDFLFAVDIYSFQPQVHPDNHCAWWQFKLPNGKHTLQLRFDLARIKKESLRLIEDQAEIQPVNHWGNPKYEIVPLMECKLVFWNMRDEIIYLKRVLLKCDDSQVLERFYEKHHLQDAYSPELPFLDLLHRYKLRILKRYYQRYFRGNVLDAGCGLSLFTAYENEEWQFRIIAGDIVYERMRQRKKERPDIHWVVFDAEHLPFKDHSFDSLFAGEILEHLPDPEFALQEWNRVQRPGGAMIITTPNRRRRVNVLNNQDWPVSPDHLREFSFEELNEDFLPRTGFEVKRKRGLYLELWTRRQWWVEDHLQREGNKQRNAWVMKILFRLGYYFPRKAFGLITVARKMK